MNEVDDDPQTYAIIGAAMEVHKQLGCGFLELVYQKALAKEFTESKIPYNKEAQFPISYKGHNLDCYYQADFVCYDNIIVELSIRCFDWAARIPVDQLSQSVRQ